MATAMRQPVILTTRKDLPSGLACTVTGFLAPADRLAQLQKGIIAGIKVNLITSIIPLQVNLFGG